MLEESSCRLPNGAVPAVPKLWQSIIDHNPNVFGSPPKPKVISTLNCISLSSTEILCNASVLMLTVVNMCGGMVV